MDTYAIDEDVVNSVPAILVRDDPIDSAVEQHGMAIDELKGTTVQCLLDIGQHLDEVHSLLAGNGRDGGFHPWVRERCGFSIRSAYNYIKAHHRLRPRLPEDSYVKCATVARFDVAAVYLLANESTPDEAIDEAVARAADGEHITRRVAAGIIDPPAETYNVDNTRQADVVPVRPYSEPAEEPTEEPSEEPAGNEKPDRLLSDREGNPIPEHSQQVFDDEHLVDNCIAILKTLRKEVILLTESPAGVALIKRDVLRSIRELKNQIEGARPYCVCPYCKGHRCTACSETGIVTKQIYEQSSASCDEGKREVEADAE